MTGRDRGAIQVVDALLGFATLVTIIVAFAPILQKAQSIVAPVLDPFSQLLLTIFVPLAILAFIISMGVSARGRR